jgi:hypothetical protein
MLFVIRYSLLEFDNCLILQFHDRHNQKADFTSLNLLTNN